MHQNRVKPCPDGFTAGYYWYGEKRKGPGRPPKGVVTLLSNDPPPSLEVDTPADSPNSSDRHTETSNDGVVDVETMSCDEDVVGEDIEVDDPDSITDEDPPDTTRDPTDQNGHDDSVTRDRHVKKQREPIRYSLRPSRRTPDRPL